MRIIITILAVLSLYSIANASELTFKFDSPSFSGEGKSSHYLTVENIEKTRKDAIKAAEKAAADKVKEDAKNTAVAKFKANLESRFYTALAKQITTNIFGADGLQQDTGSFTSPIGGELVEWTTPSGTGNVVVTVTETDGTVTTFTMPKED
ncbi:uncharacterized protein METZ01_LOCUS55118 [marine metagenome]|jgi:hypothetical protein|uniref:Curli production assembly/transport component CsgF n=1 Tax=marine metagenome TaxID=408172 RepID=A0A381SFL5_9ZZZZ|tara:strand:+ start:299 stop:751 length:453 start_codon:yes stop_codon:yes gene_type:complete